MKNDSLSVPFELVVNIARFLSLGDLLKWRFIHPAFAEVALEKRYCEVSFPHSYVELDLQLHTMCSKPGIASRVQTLKVEPDRIWDALALKKISTPASRHPRIIFSSSGPVHSTIGMRTPKSDRQERLITTDGLRDALICFAKDLINVDKLDIRWEPSKSAIRKQNPLCPVLSIFLPTFGSNLRTLSVVLPNSVATSLLPTMAVSLKDLQELRIDLLRDDFGWAPPISLPTLLPMINGVSRTLRSLWISAPGVGGSSSAFFEGFSQFPCLSRLHLKNTMNFSDVQCDLFLPLSSDDHRHRLIVAAEQPLGTQWIGQWRSFRTVVVEAEGHDGIDSVLSNLSRPARIKALCRASSSLVALEPALKFYEIKGLISHFSSLERLTLTVENLTTELLDFLVESCRSLTHLCVEIQRTSSSEFNEKLYDEMRFCFEMRARQGRPLYKSSGLCDLSIWTLQHASSKKQYLWTAIRAVAACTPALRSCCGVNIKG